MKVYMFGGYENQPIYHNSLWAFDLETKQWKPKAQMKERRCYVATTVFQVMSTVLGDIRSKVQIM